MQKFQKVTGSKETWLLNSYIQLALRKTKSCIFSKLLRNSIYSTCILRAHWCYCKGGIHKLRWQARGEGGLAKCQRYYISWCSKLVNEGGGGSKIFKIFSMQFMDAPLEFWPYVKEFQTCWQGHVCAAYLSRCM